MPTWLQVLGGLSGLLMCTIGVIYFWDRYFRTRRSSSIDHDLSDLQKHSWSLKDRLDLESRLTRIESKVATVEEKLAVTAEMHDELMKVMANILHSPHRPELDRLLEKIARGERLNDAELMFATCWLEEIASSKSSGISTGEQSVAGTLLAMLISKYKNLPAENRL